MINTDGRNKIGIYDLEKKEYIIPSLYDNIITLPQGFLAYDNDSQTIYIYTRNGKPLVQFKQNQKPLLLFNNIILFTSEDSQYCMIWNGNTGNYLCQKKFESILFFVGSSTEPTAYSGKFDLEKLLSNKDFKKNGACFDKFICLSYKKHWGVINSTTGKIIFQFEADTAIQQKSTDIILGKGKETITINKENGDILKI